MNKIISKLLVFTLCLSMVLSFSTNVEAKSKESIKLNKTKLTMYVGGTYKLKVKGSVKNVKWSSSKKSIVSVNKGKLKAKKKGSAVVYAKVGSKKLKCKVTVKKPYLSSKLVSIPLDGTYKLKLKGAKVKSWSSKDTRIATISKNGLVVAKSKGSTTIICKDTKGKKYSCKVNVVEKSPLNSPIPAPTVTSIPSGVEDAENGLTCTPIVKVDPTNTPTTKPTKKPTNTPTPTKKPTKKPTNTPTPTKKPTNTPTPTKKPTNTPTPTHSHTYVIDSSVSATCTKKGSVTFKCKSCGHTYSQEIAELGHNITSKKVNPEEYSAGYDLCSCSRCSHSYKSYENSFDINYRPTTLKCWEIAVYDNKNIINLESYTGGRTQDLLIPGVAFIGDRTYKVTIGYEKDDVYDLIPSSVKPSIKSLCVSQTKLYNAIGLFSNLSNLETAKLYYVEVNKDTSFEELFSYCSKLKEVNMRNVQLYNVYSLYGAFRQCTSLTSVTFPGQDDFYGNKTIDYLSLGCTFEGCSNLETFDMGTTLIKDTTLGCTFKDCSSLSYIHLGNIQGDLYTLSETFSGCSSLSKVNFNSATDVKSGKCDNTFKGCPYVHSVYVVYNNLYDFLLDNCVEMCLDPNDIDKGQQWVKE